MVRNGGWREEGPEWLCVLQPRGILVLLGAVGRDKFEKVGTNDF